MAKKANISIVVPTNREENIKKFLSSWEKEFKGFQIIIVEDNPTKLFDLPPFVEHYSWKDIDQELGEKSWIIPRRCAAIRSFGFLKAWQSNSDYIITLDDDCLPEEEGYGKLGFVKSMLQALETKWEDDSWWNTIGETGMYPRGYPYNIRKKNKEVVIHHGLWSNIPDFDGITQKQYPNYRTKSFKKLERIPSGKFFPMCSMNLAFKRKILPAMYFLLMGEDRNGKKWGYDRFDDIWAGIFVKKIVDHLGFVISNGMPSVQHIRASNIDLNIAKEKKGIRTNELIWKKIKEVNLIEPSIPSCYLEIADSLKNLGNYFFQLNQAIKIWTSLTK